jgi:phosphate-selective porin OprO/OprP
MVFTLTPALSHAEDSGEATPDSTIDTTVEAGEADAEEPRRKLVKWNEYDGPISSLRLGFGFLADLASYSQDNNSKQQFDLEPDAGVRDFRLVLTGRFKTGRELKWTVGYMYDGADDVWRFRQTGLDIGVPELSGRIWVGRQKEGYSMVKVMNGYHPWSMERSPAMDAFIPILADGVRYIGYFKRSRINFTLGWFTDTLTEDEKFASYDTQVAARLGWLPILSEEDAEVLHVAVMVRDGEPDEGMLQVRSRPELNLAPYFVDTGKLPADHVRGTGFEAYYRKGPWLFGTEYNWQDVSPVTGGDVLFHAGDAVATWLITGETRAYRTRDALFAAVSPRKTVFEGGPGAWEAVLRVSYTDFDSGAFHGGKFWRLTPMVNWHMSDNVRLEFVYGYGILDRFDLKGATQFFQVRIQTTL